MGSTLSRIVLTLCVSVVMNRYYIITESIVFKKYTKVKK